MILSVNKVMKIFEVIEHIIVPDQTFGVPPISNGQDAGQIAIKSGIANVYVKREQNIVQIIAHRNNKPLGFVILVIVPNKSNLAMAKNAQAYVVGESILLNLLVWAKRNFGLRIISDYEMTRKGERAWQELTKNPQLNVKIYNFTNDTVHDLTDPSITRPENDVPSEPPTTNWFYIIECSSFSKFGINEGKQHLLMPYFYTEYIPVDKL